MHEMAIGETILKIIDQEAKKNSFTKIKSAKLRIGRMEAFEKANLELCLKTYNGGALSDTKFEIEDVPVSLKCTSCKECYMDTRFDNYDFAHKTAHAPGLYTPVPCPECGSIKAEITGGQEMEIVSIEGE
jgi:hydrogenase nickel incorporation protein HypA/HybF